MLLEYVWCDKININGKNSFIKCTHSQVRLLCVLTDSVQLLWSYCWYLGYVLLISFPVEVWHVVYVMHELVCEVDFTNMLFRYELLMMVVGLNKQLFVW